MSRTVYVNGDFLPEADAKISVFDRGFLFADGVYEVSAVVGGKLVDNAAHLARLDRSLQELGMTPPAKRSRPSRRFRQTTTPPHCSASSRYRMVWVRSS